MAPAKCSGRGSSARRAISRIASRSEGGGELSGNPLLVLGTHVHQILHAACVPGGGFGGSVLRAEGRALAPHESVLLLLGGSSRVGRHEDGDVEPEGDAERGDAPGGAQAPIIGAGEDRHWRFLTPDPAQMTKSAFIPRGWHRSSRGSRWHSATRSDCPPDRPRSRARPQCKIARSAWPRC